MFKARGLPERRHVYWDRLKFNSCLVMMEHYMFGFWSLGLVTRQLFPSIVLLRLERLAARLWSSRFLEVHPSFELTQNKVPALPLFHSIKEGELGFIPHRLDMKVAVSLFLLPHSYVCVGHPFKLFLCQILLEWAQARINTKWRAWHDETRFHFGGAKNVHGNKGST